MSKGSETARPPGGDALLVAIGLLVAVGAGLSGGLFEAGSTQSVLYALSSLGWVVATALLCLRHARRGESTVAAGFMLLTIAEAMLWAGGRPGDPGYLAGFAGGTMFYVPGLLLVGLPAVYSLLVRTTAVLGAGVWAVGAAISLTGGEFAGTDPLALVGYTLVSLAYVGVAVRALRQAAVLPESRRLTPTMAE